MFEAYDWILVFCRAAFCFQEWIDSNSNYGIRVQTFRPSFLEYYNILPRIEHVPIQIKVIYVISNTSWHLMYDDLLRGFNEKILVFFETKLLEISVNKFV